MCVKELQRKVVDKSQIYRLTEEGVGLGANEILTR